MKVFKIIEKMRNDKKHIRRCIALGFSKKDFKLKGFFKRQKRKSERKSKNKIIMEELEINPFDPNFSSIGYEQTEEEDGTITEEWTIENPQRGIKATSRIGFRNAALIYFRLMNESRIKNNVIK